LLRAARNLGVFGRDELKQGKEVGFVFGCRR
jgi:hypothetical protein